MAESLMEKEALKEKDAAIQTQKTSDQAQRPEIQTQQVQQDTIQAQQSEIEQLSKQTAVAEQVKHPLRDWRKLGECRKVIKHSPNGSGYFAIAVNSEGLLAVTDGLNLCVHLLTNDGTLVRSIGEGVLGGYAVYGVCFDLKGNVWVTDFLKNNIVKLSQDGRLLQTIHLTRGEGDSVCQPAGVAVSPEGLVYICDSDNCRVAVYNEEGKFLFAFGSNGRDKGCFVEPRAIAFGSDGLVYVTDEGKKRICVWSKEGTFKRQFKSKYAPHYIAATSDNHLLITSVSANNVMIYTLEGELIHEFGANGRDPGEFNVPWGICVHEGSGLVYVADGGNWRIQVFS